VPSLEPGVTVRAGLVTAPGGVFLILGYDGHPTGAS